MQTLHLLGHNRNWNLDSHYDNSIGDGFIFSAFSHPHGYLQQPKIGKRNMDEILSKSFLDLQYFGKKETVDVGELKTYEFHSINIDPAAATNVQLIAAMNAGIDYQVNLGLKNIIIPNYYENDNVEKLVAIINQINKDLSKKKQEGLTYYMTLPITRDTIIDAEKIETLLYNLTDRKIVFDGYYVMCEARTENMQKVCLDYKYLRNLSRVFEVLKQQNFRTIYAYANWDAMIFLSATDIDYISIGTFETLRKFNIKRFTTKESGGPSKGWYYSEKLLNFVKAQELDLIRQQKGMDLIVNNRNIFSDIILGQNYIWSNNKPDVHKNYLLAIDRQLKQLASISDLTSRKNFMLDWVNQAADTYQSLQTKKINLPTDSSNYHLDTWKSHLSRN